MCVGPDMCIKTACTSWLAWWMRADASTVTCIRFSGLLIRHAGVAGVSA